MAKIDTPASSEEVKSVEATTVVQANTCPEFDRFQDQMWEYSSLHRDLNKGMLYLAAGLSEESNEVLALINKHVHHGKPLDRKKLIEELGDTLWYLAMCAKKENIALSEVATAQIQKIKKRYPHGYTQEHFFARLDEKE